MDMKRALGAKPGALSIQRGVMEPTGDYSWLEVSGRVLPGVISICASIFNLATWFLRYSSNLFAYWSVFALQLCSFVLQPAIGDCQRIGPGALRHILVNWSKYFVFWLLHRQLRLQWYKSRIRLLLTYTVNSNDLLSSIQREFQPLSIPEKKPSRTLTIVMSNYHLYGFGVPDYALNNIAATKGYSNLSV